MLIGFDLDDTLYKERDYVASGRAAVAEAVSLTTDVAARDAARVMAGGADPFDALEAYLRQRGVEGWPVSRMVEVYRTHRPSLQPDAALNALLGQLRRAGHRVAIITDGQSERQRAKIAALGLDGVVDAVYISDEVGGDKHTGRGFDAAVADFPCAERVYIGDNPAKDFAYASAHGWATVMLADSDGTNIHPQRGGVPARTVIFDLPAFLRTLLPREC